MNILLLGNGFDLYYKFPTKYHNFLNTVKFLLDNYNLEMKSIGDVFGDKALQDTDCFISESYQKYKNAYDNTVLDCDKITELLTLMQNNLWFEYLLKSFNKDVGWIDFEKEILLVIKCFQEFFDVASVKFDENLMETSVVTKYIINTFDFFVGEKDESRVFFTGRAFVSPREVKEEYRLEYPLNSGNFVINKDKIIEELAEALNDLAKALQLYLACFVESIFDKLKDNHCIDRCEALLGITHTVTLNYTNTYETFYKSGEVFHVHGLTDGKIVLGVNPNEDDESKHVDTSFLLFKKYFQRVMYETDIEYLKWIATFYDISEPYTITVMGHSLDITDEDIVNELFSFAGEIIILYHNDAAKASYISNLVKLYGKSNFEMLRSDQKLTFVSLDSDLTWIPEKREQEENRKAFIETFLDEE